MNSGCVCNENRKIETSLSKWLVIADVENIF